MAEVGAFTRTRRPRPTRTSDFGNMPTNDPAQPPIQGAPVPITTTTSVRVFTRSETTTIINPASTITVVSVVPSVPSPQLVPDDSHLDSTTAFFKNTAAVAATFTVVGLAILGILAFCLIRSVRYHRARLEESQTQIEAARPARLLGDTDSEDAHRVAERRSAAGLIVPGEKRESRLRYSAVGLTPMDMPIRGSMEKASLDEYYDASGARRTSMSGKRVSSSPSVAQAQREAMMLHARSYSAAADLGAGGSGGNPLHRLPPEMMAFGGTSGPHPPSSAYAAIRASTSLDVPRSSSSVAPLSTESELSPPRVGFEPRRPSVDYLENGFGYGHRSSSQGGGGGLSDLSSSEAGAFSSSNRRPSLDQISTSSSSFAGHFSKRSSLKDWTEGLKQERLAQGSGSGEASKSKGKQRESSRIEMTRRRSSAQGPQVKKALHTSHGSLASAPGMMEALAIPLSATTNSNPPTPTSGPIARIPSSSSTTPLVSPLPPSPYTRSSSRGSIALTPSPSQAQVQIQPTSNFISDSPRSLFRALSPPPAPSRSNTNTPTKRTARRPSTAPSLLSVGESESKFRPSEKHANGTTRRKNSIETAESGGSGGSELPPQQRSFVVMRRRPSTAPQATSPRLSIFGEPGPSTDATTTTTSSATATPAMGMPLGDGVPNSPSKFRITNLADDEELDSSSTGHGHDAATVGAVDEPHPVVADSRKGSISSTIPTLSRASTFSRPSLGSRPSTSGTGTGTVDDEEEELYPTFGRALIPSPIPPLEINHPGPSRRPQLKARSSSTSSSASRPSTAPSPSVPTLLTPAPKKRRPSTATAASTTSGATVRPNLRIDSTQVGTVMQHLMSPSTGSTTTTPSPSPKPSPGLSAAASASTPTTSTTANPDDTPQLAKGVEVVDYFSRRGSVGVADPSSDPSAPLLGESYSNNPHAHPHANMTAPPVLPVITGLGLQSIDESDAASWFSNHTTTSPVQDMPFRPLSPSLSPPTSPTLKRVGSKSPGSKTPCSKRSGSGSGSGSHHGRSSSGSQEGGGVGSGPLGGRASVSRASVDTTLSSLRDDHDYTPGRLGLRVANA